MGHENDLVVERLHFDHDVDVTGTRGRWRAKREPDRNQSDKLLDLARGQLCDDGAAGILHLLDVDALDVDLGIAERRTNAGLKELRDEILPGEPPDGAIASQAFVSGGKLSTGDSRQRGQIERESEPGDDLRELGRLARS